MNSLYIDEVEAVERPKMFHLTSSIFHLVFADLCADYVYEERTKKCYGCEIDHPSQTHHDCLMMSDEDIWMSYYDDSKVQVQNEKVWETVNGV